MAKKLFLLIIVLFAVAMAVPSTRAQIQENGIDRVTNAIGARLAPGRLNAMADQLDARLQRAERLPTEGFENWIRIDYTGPERDPWGNWWFLQVGRREYTVGTMGPDGARGTDDDITVSRPMPSGPLRP
jgi:hypothetical protein